MPTRRVGDSLGRPVRQMPPVPSLSALTQRVRRRAARTRFRLRKEHPALSRRAVRAAERVRAVRARRWPREPDRPLEQVLFAYARARPDATFVQIGAHDGTQLDPLREAVLGSGWTGVMVEPVPYVFERLAERYGANPRLALENCAIAEHEGVQELHHLPELPPGDAAWKWYDALGSFRRDVVLRHDGFVPDIGSQLVATEVPCLTFDGLCARRGLERVDVVQIDTEGYDLVILEQIDLDRYRPDIVVFEHLHLDEDERRRASELLTEAGYDHVRDGMDTLALGPDAASIPAVAAAFATATATLAEFA